MSHDSSWVIGMDLSDKTSAICRLDHATGEVFERTITLTASSLDKHFGGLERCRIVLEVGTHSRWVSWHLDSLGFEVLVVEPTAIPLITKSISKSDRNDARLLAELGASCPSFLRMVKHRSAKAHGDLAILKCRHALVRQRSSLISLARGMTKSFGERLPRCSPVYFADRVREELPAALRNSVGPILTQIKRLTEQIRRYERQITKLIKTRYPAAQRVQQIPGVGEISALAFVLVLEDPTRFVKSRQVGSYLGLRPKQQDSGSVSKQLAITKAGDRFTRTLLVNCANYILGPFGPAQDLRTWGLDLASRGGGAGKKRAIVAVARKLSVLMHRLWISGEDYVPEGYSSKRSRAVCIKQSA